MVNQKTKSISWTRSLINRGWRFLRGLLIAGLVVILLIVLVVAFPMTRSGLLRVALSQAHRFLPGELTVENISWPGLGRLEFQGVVWRVAADDSLAGAAVGDTLAQVAELKLEVGLEALREHDLLVREIFMTAGPVDIPRIIQLFPASQDSTTAGQVDTLNSGSSFLRPSELPMVPSLAVESLRITARDTRLSETLTLARAGLEGTLEMRVGHELSAHFGQGRVRLEARQDELIILDVDQLGLALSADIPQRKIMLDSLVLRVPEAGTPDILDAWNNAEAVTLRLAGQGRWTETGGSVVLDGVGSLPGPDHLRPLLSPHFPADISGSLVGDFHVEATVPDLSKPDPTGRVRMDFSQTAWLDRLLLVAGIEQGRITVDTLDVGLLGAHLAVSGVVDSTEIDARLDAAMVEPTLLHLFGGAALADAEADFDLQATMKGLWPVPDVDMDLKASARTSDINVPLLTGSIRTRDRLAQVILSMDQGLESGAVSLDSLQLNWAGDLSRPDSLTHRFDLGVYSPMGRITLGGSGTVDTLRTVILDSLIVVGLDSTMRTDQPATIIYGPGPRDLKVKNFHLAGSLGTIGLDGSLDDSGLTLQMAVDLLLQESFLMAVAPNDIWNSGGGTDMSIKAGIDLEGGAEGPVFTGKAGVHLIPHRDDPQVGVELDFYLVRGDSSGLGADLRLLADSTRLLTGRFRWPGQPDLKTGKWIPDSNEGLRVSFPRQEFDLATLNQVMPADVSLDGMLSFGGGMQEVLNADDLAEPIRGLAGLGESQINAHLGVEKLDVDLPNRSRVAMRIDTNLEGTVSAPKVVGEIEVLSGYFRIPELPRALLPVEGESLLWQAMAQRDGAAGDSLATGDPVDPEIQGPVLGEATPVFIPELDVRLKMPGNVIVNGYGLNIELEGNLHATRGEDFEGTAMVVLEGHAGVRQGTMKFMNNVFDVEKADIRFSGAAPPNPHLDIQLKADVSGYIIYLKVSAFADDPVIELSSEPDMNEADIIAVLLFGQPTNDLDNDQRGRADDENDPGAQLKENLAALAVVFGGAGIQNQMSNTLGVDMVEMGSDSDGDSTIMVGKFLTPRVLLKYNQSLEKSGTYFMTMEYRLSQYFKLLSTYGQGEEASGLELKWTRRY